MNRSVTVEKSVSQDSTSQTDEAVAAVLGGEGQPVVIGEVVYEKCVALKEGQGNLKEEIAQLKEELAQAKTEVENINSTLSSVTEMAQRKDSEIGSLKNVFETELAAKQEALVENEAEVGRLALEVAKLGAAVQSSEIARENSERELLMKEKELSENLEKIGELESEIRNLTKKLEETESQEKNSIVMITSELESSRLRVEELEKQILLLREVEVRLVESQEESRQLREDLRLVKESQVNLEKENGRLAFLEEEVATLRQVSKEQLIQSEEAMDDKEKEIKDLKLKNSELVTALENVKQVMHEQEMARLETIRLQNEQLEELKKSTAAGSALGDEEREKLETEVEKECEKGKRLQKEVDRLTQVEVLLRKSKRRLEGLCDEADVMEANLKKSLEEREQEIDELRKELVQAKQVGRSVSSFQAEMDSLRELLKKVEAECEEKSIKLQQDGMRVADLDRELMLEKKQRKKEVSTLRGELEYRNERIRQLKDELRVAQEQAVDSTVKIQGHEGGAAKKRAEEGKRERVGNCGMETATGSGVIDALQYYEEKQKTYEATKKVKELEKKIEALQQEIMTLRGESVTEREAASGSSSSWNDKENEAKGPKQVAGRLEGDGGVQSLKVGGRVPPRTQSLRENETRGREQQARSFFGITTPRQKSVKKSEEQSTAGGLKTPVQRKKLTVFGSSQNKKDNAASGGGKTEKKIKNAAEDSDKAEGSSTPKTPAFYRQSKIAKPTKAASPADCRQQ